MSDKERIIMIPDNKKEVIIPQNVPDDIKKHGLEPGNLPIQALKPIEKQTGDSKNEK